MYRSATLLCALAVGCTPTDGSVDIGGGTTGITSTPTPGTVTPTATTSANATVSCVLDESNALLVWCDVAFSTPLAATLELSADGLPTRTFVVDQPSDSHQIVGWGLKAETEYSWSLGGASGTVVTGSLPMGFDDLEMDRTGSFDSFDGLLIPTDCGGGSFVIFDSEGDVIWYTRDTMYGDAMDAYDWVQETRSVLVGDGSEIKNVHVSGLLTLELDDVSGNTHHDMDWWGGYTYVLHEYGVSGLNVDGIHVYEGETLIDTFRLEDHFDLVGGGSFGDWSHANGVNPTEDGVIVMSLLNFDTILGIDGDPASATFLDLLWQAEGTADGLPGSDYVAPGGTGLGFGGQHNAQIVDDRLWMFDNQGEGGESRAARYELSDASGEVVLEESWGMDQYCSFQGGAEPVPGGVLATCAPTRDIRLFELDNPDPVFTMNADCGNGGFFSGAMNRAVPIWVE